MTEVEIQRDMLNQVVKHTIKRIKELQNQLVIEKKPVMSWVLIQIVVNFIENWSIGLRLL